MGGMAHMVPYFHSYYGDYLFLKSWQPKSAGAVAGACIGLFVLAIIDRFVSAIRGSFERHWRNQLVNISQISSFK